MTLSSPIASPFRVLMVIPSIASSGGGVSEVARLYAEEWIKQDKIEIEVVTLRTDDFEEHRDRWPLVPIFEFPRIGPNRFGAAKGMIWFLLRRDYDIAYVHGLWTFHVLAALIWSVRHKRPYVFCPHGMLEPWIVRRSKFIKKLVSATFQSWFIRRASGVHALTDSEVSAVRKLGIDLEIALIPNFVVDQDPPLPLPQWWKPELDGRKTFLFLGRIHEKKGWRELLEAWSLCCERDDSFRLNSQLVFAGWIDGAVDFELRICELYERFHNVYFVGRQVGDEKFRSFGAADFFILPSKSEGLPMTVLEAWSVGCPTLMTRECNLPIGFDRGASMEIGVDRDSIAKALLHVQMLTLDQHLAMRQNARRLQVAEFSAAACAMRLLAFLRDIARSGSAK